MKKVLTLFIVHDDSQILLGMKKKGFGEGRWNGFGGKVQEGESVQEAAIREIREEAGIIPQESQKRGVLLFTFDGNPEILEVHVFSATSFEGEIRESEEMKPQWFLKSEIPFDDMWPDDRHWLPLLLNGKNFEGSFTFRGNTLTECKLKEIEYA